jgi:Collagen triple helix repeat (20 copies)
MKTNTNFLKAAILIATIIISNACKGPAGDPGPAGKDGANGQNGANGAAGSMGAQGVSGANGTPGVTGATGTANVIYGTWQDMSNPDFWYKLGAPETGGSNNGGGSGNVFAKLGFGCDFYAPITQDILDKGQVLVYGKFRPDRNDNRVYFLPFTLNGYFYMGVNILLNKIFRKAQLKIVL